MDIPLTLPEFDSAVNAARLRIIASTALGLNDATTYSRDMMTRFWEELVGACGEVAIGKAANVWFVPSVNTFHRVPDCLGDVEVRATDLDSGCLILRNNDADDRRYVLAIVNGTGVSLRGWMIGSEAKEKVYERDPNGYGAAWFVPQRDLRPMKDFVFRDTVAEQSS